MQGCRLRLLAFLMFGITSSAFSEDRDEAKINSAIHKTSDLNTVLGNLYSSVELRHHLNTYYDRDDFRAKQEPSFHARAVIGSVFKEGLIDAYATFGAIKLSDTQEVVQRRPEFEIDIFPLSATYGKIIQYNIVQTPFKEDARISENGQAIQYATTYTFGLAPSVFFPVEINEAKLKISAGVDYWTELFSRKQKRDEEERDHFSAAGDETTRGSSEGEGQEDTAMRHYTEYMVGGSISPAWLRSFELEAAAFYDVDFFPKYAEDESGDYKYISDKSSHYRLRMQYEISERCSFINDFYHFHDGFFEQKISGEDRRYRNIARISYRL